MFLMLHEASTFAALRNHVARGRRHWNAFAGCICRLCTFFFRRRALFLIPRPVTVQLMSARVLYSKTSRAVDSVRVSDLCWAQTHILRANPEQDAHFAD
jgi:hypothetical protein